MDGAKFDSLTRLLFATESRREAITMAAASIGAQVSLGTRDAGAKGGRGKGGGKKKGKNKKKKDKRPPPPTQVCKNGGDFCAGTCCPPLHRCVMTVAFGVDPCCPAAQVCTSADGAMKTCCPASSEPITGCCVGKDAQGNIIDFCCYGDRTCGYDEDKNGSCCRSGEKPCGGSCCSSNSFCCARTKNGLREYACCPNDGQTRCMKDRPDLRPCCSNC